MICKIILYALTWMFIFLIAACQSVPNATTISPLQPQNSPGTGEISPTKHFERNTQTTTTPFLMVTANPANSYLQGDNAVQSAINDLGKRLGVNPDSIELSSVTTEDLPAENLGCPLLQKHQREIPAFVHGKIIHLLWRDQEYEYRSHAGQVVYCQPSMLPGTITSSP